VPEFDKRKYIIMKSLQHYSEALVKLLAYEELPEIVKFDLNNEYVKLHKLQSIVDTKGVIQNVDDESHSVLEIEVNAKLVHSALTCYVKDIEKSISEIDELYGDKTIPLDDTIRDIVLAQKELEEISKIQAI
jgi:Glu-tRNA(Gln) amidotransferase subunit E-like FAD-binding protein